MLFDPLELIERLAVLVPPPRFHLVRYDGILAPRASWRDEVVPAAGVRVGRTEGRVSSDSVPTHATKPNVEGEKQDTGAEAPIVRRLPWAHLLARVFLVDALCCPRCSKRMRILSAIQTPDAIRSILDCLGLPTRPPPITPAIPSAPTSADVY
jgi:hypothetical protein